MFYAHPVVSSALDAQRVHREYPVTYDANGDLHEGVIDLVSFDGSGWTVLDYKTGPGDEPRYRRQVAIYGEIIRKTMAAPWCSRFVSGPPILFVIHNAESKEIEFGAAVHGALDQLQSVNMSLDWSVAPRLLKGGK